MKEININTSFTVFQSVNELPQDVQSLMQQAVKIRKKAYAPYSKFRVGAALLLDNGKIVLGSNQENAAYPSGLCAEKSCYFSKRRHLSGCQNNQISGYSCLGQQRN